MDEVEQLQAKVAEQEEAIHHLGRAVLSANQVVLAWTKPGPRPDIHREAQARLAKEWPTLHRAVVNLVGVINNGEAPS